MLDPVDMFMLPGVRFLAIQGGFMLMALDPCEGVVVRGEVVATVPIRGFGQKCLCLSSAVRASFKRGGQEARRFPGEWHSVSGALAPSPARLVLVTRQT